MIDLLNYELLLSDNYVVLDFETDTSGGHFGVGALSGNQALLACWKTAGSKVWSKWGNELNQEELLDALSACDYFVAHNAKYELGWLRRMGFDLRSKGVVCTQLAEHVILGNLGPGDKHNQPPLGLSLDDCVTRRGGPGKDPAVDRMIRDGINPTRIPRGWLKQRCLQDVATTESLWLDQRKTLHETGKLALCWTRGTLTSPPLADIEWRGMTLDGPAVEETHAAYQLMYNELLQQMDEMTGGINWRSPKQAADFLYGESNESFEGRVKLWLETDGSTAYPVRVEGLGFIAPIDKKTGVEDRTTRQAVLDSFTGTTKAQKAFIALRKETSKVGSALSKALDFYLGVTREKGGTFLAELNQSKAATHRLSSTGIPIEFEMYEEPKSAQFQNQPRIFKKLFKAPWEGWNIGEWDGSQLEYRVAGHLSRDPQIRQDIIEQHDVHRFTAAVLFHAPKEWIKNIEEHIDDIKGLMHLVTKEQRQAAKPDTFKPVYGGQSGTPRQMAYYKAFRARYHKLAAVQEGWVHEVLTNKGTLTTEYGLQY